MQAHDETLPTAMFIDIDRAGPIPLYYQLASRIEAAILDGRIPAGARIDNEVGLGERLGISRPTVRRAIQDLVDKGLLVRRRGIGTQVVHGEVSRKVELTSLFDDLTSTGRRPSTRVLAREVTPATAAVAERLGVEAGSPTLHVRRLRLADAVPLAVLENHLPADFVDISDAELAEFGLYQVMGGRGVTIRVARQRIGARSASTDEAELLDLDRHSAVLTMDRVAYDNNGRAVEYGHHAYRPDLYSFDVTVVGK